VKTCYVIPEVRAIADLVPPGELTNHWTITRINVPVRARGKGFGADLLEQITADADAEGESLALEALASGGLDHDQLVSWYLRAGFRRTSGGYFLRKAQ
jgi:ribosomal protein S18 acetylase RimI-like enzyme